MLPFASESREETHVLADSIFTIPQWFFLSFFIFQTICSLFLELIAFHFLVRHLPRRVLDDLPRTQTRFEPQISILVPAYNEEQTIADSVRSLLQLQYAEFEVVVINDGSKDRTLDVLIEEFELIPFPEAYPANLRTERVRAVYRSKRNSKVRVIDKDNGGKADALNVGINLSRNPLFCTLDSDSILQRDSLQRVVQPFLDDPSTVASGGTVRIANGCQVRAGYLTAVGLPASWLGRFQVVEYVLAFWIGRLGWNPFNAMLIISGAFGLFRKDTVVRVGGYAKGCHGEDMELIVRLHRHLRLRGERYRISFVPHAFCWSEAPENLRSLKSQRIRWQRGLSEALLMNKQLLFHPRAGTVGWLSMPFMVLFEWLSPAVLVAGYLYATVGCLMGLVSPASMAALLAAEIGMGIVVSVSVLLVDEIAFHTYPEFKQARTLCAAAILQNLGFRQLNACWRLIGLWQSMTGAKVSWGSITRTAAWRAPGAERH